MRSIFIKLFLLIAAPWLNNFAMEIAEAKAQTKTPAIIFLKGTGCAGKTSMCKVLADVDKSWKIVDEDAVYFQHSMKRWKTIFPNEMSIINKVIAKENLFHAITRDQICFIKDAEFQDKQNALCAIKKIRAALNDSRDDIKEDAKKLWNNYLAQYLVFLITDYAANDYNVIVDTWLFLKPEMYDQFKKNFKVIEALAYCSFGNLVKRMIKRNNKALETSDYSSMRLFRNSLMSFANYYELKAVLNEDEKDKVIDVIKFQEMQEAFSDVEKALDKYNDTIFTPKEFSEAQFTKFKEEMLAKFQSQEMCYVLPKLKYDTIILTNVVEPNVCANHLNSFKNNTAQSKM